MEETKKAPEGEREELYIKFPLSNIKISDVHEDILFKNLTMTEKCELIPKLQDFIANKVILYIPTFQLL